MINVIKKHKSAFLEGMRDSIPIDVGYFVVAFSLGITAKKAGLSAFQGLITSALCNASAGEYAGFLVIASDASYLTMAAMIFIANIRYLLMSCALSQRADPNLSLIHRLLISFDVTDELFGITIARKGLIDPYYNYGAYICAIPSWALGTMFGVIAGNILPLRLVSALGVALYGMFLAIIIPPTRKDKVIAVIVPVCFVFSFAATVVPYIKDLSDGTRTIILTVVISAFAALFFPVKKEMSENEA